MGPAARRRAARRDLVPLARGPARQALPRRPHARLHLPARPARLRLRPDAAGRARVPALRRADAGRGRRQPALEVRPPAGRPQAHRRGGARMTPAPARSRSRPHPRTSTVAPRAPRRVSGPARTPQRRGMVAAPAGGAGLPRRGTTGVFARVRALPEHRVVDRLLRSRLWIWALGALLAASWRCRSRCSSSTPASRARSRRRRRSSARTPRSSSRSRGCPRPTGSRRAPRRSGMVLPAAGDVGYLTAGSQDAARAVAACSRRPTRPRALLANDGIVPGSLHRGAGDDRRGDPDRRDGGDDAGDGHDDDDRDARDARRHARPDRPGGDHRAVHHHDDDHDLAQRRGGRAAGVAVGLIERRIGLLFAVFLGMLLLAGARAGWLGVVRATRSRTPPPPSRRTTSSSPPGAARSPTSTAPSSRSRSRRRRSPRRRT